MIKLYQFKPAFGLPNPSPFCMKVETYLRMVGLPFEIAPNADPRKAPKGKLPYIEDDGRVMGDSGLIIEYLKATYGDSLDGGLSAVDRAVALGFQKLMEENLYWSNVYARWCEPRNWEITKAAFFSRLPTPQRLFVPAVVRRILKREMYGHGMGRHSAVFPGAAADLARCGGLCVHCEYHLGADRIAD